MSAREPAITACALGHRNVYRPRMPRDTPAADVASIVDRAPGRGDGVAVNVPLPVAVSRP
jgi:hypothetical protein